MFVKKRLSFIFHIVVFMSIHHHAFADTNKAGTFSIANSGSNKVALKTNVLFYSASSSCGGSPDCSHVNTAGANSYTFTPNTSINISASGIYGYYQLAGCSTSVLSIYVIPYYDTTGGGSYSPIFSAGGGGGCFVIDNNCASSICTGTTAAAVTLKP